MLVCFTMGGGLERFFRMRYHIFLGVTICATTHVTILLWKFCTVSEHTTIISSLLHWPLYALLYIISEISR